MERVPNPDLPHYQLYIDGSWTEAANGGVMAVNEAAIGRPMAYVARGSIADVDRAVQAARNAFDSGPWPHTPPAERARILHAIADMLQEHAEEFAETESRNLGVPLRKSLFVDTQWAVEHFRTFAELARRSPYEPLPWNDVPTVSWSFVWREPIGVCAQIVAWNYPLLFVAWKLAPALATGNTIVFKPASYTPLTALKLVELIDQSGLLPRGVLNLITGPGSEIGDALSSHADVDKITLTGSTETGRRVMSLAAGTIKRVTLELGGKSPALLLPDVDLDVAVDGLVWGAFLNAGQSCEAMTRCLVPEGLHDELLDRLTQRVRGLTIGNPLDLTTDIGPLVSDKQRQTVEAYVAIGRQEGAQVAIGGRRALVEGFEHGPFYEPTIFTRVRNDMRIAQEEIFGPVLAVIPYREVREAIELANKSSYGLAASVWSRDLQAAIDVGKRIRSGAVWINDAHMLNPSAPFGGYKQSGLGREHGLQGLLEYTETKQFYVDLKQKRDGRIWWDAVLPPLEED